MPPDGKADGRFRQGRPCPVVDDRRIVPDFLPARLLAFALPIALLALQVPARAQQTLALHDRQYLPDTSDAIEQLARAAKANGHWRCDSRGGLLAMGILLGRWLEELKVPVEIRAGDVCLSAAAVAVLGSPKLVKSGQGLLAFHGATPLLTPFLRGLLDGSLQRWQVPHDMRHRLLDMQPGEWWVPDPWALRDVWQMRMAVHH
jgi:hypothetical protein